MLEARELWDLARSVGRDGFLSRQRAWVLLKHPDAGLAMVDPKFDYHTVAIRTDGPRLADPYPNEWRLANVVKREGNPFPERISVGRANNCDVVLRLPFVSKLHAHFVGLETGALRIADNRSANGTTVAGRTLAPGETVACESGDWIGFGPLRLQLLDPNDLLDALGRAFEP
jgi:FHA domain